MRHSHSEAGSVLIYIFLAIVLFASLSFAVSNIMRSGDPTTIPRETAKSYATDIMQQANGIRRAIQVMGIDGYEDTAISFENDFVSGYTNPNCTDNGCKVFHPNGGGLTYIVPNEGWLDTSFRASYNGDPSRPWGPWAFTGQNSFPDVGTVCNTADCKELSLWLHFVKKDVCVAINNSLGIANPSGLPPTERLVSPPGTIASPAFTGTYFNASQGVDVGAGPAMAACLTVEDPANDEYYAFYQVLIAR
ncbi:MAG: hypothetical protein H6868_02445 [Rhodospirillales bacterium]|nr:hypothetical protein [Rhodospirillales bacterium]